MARIVAKGVVGSFNYVVVGFSEGDIADVMDDAWERQTELAELLAWGSDEDLVERVRRREIDLADIGVEMDIYLPSVRETAVELIVNRLVGKPEAEVSEEDGYGLPEYSLYWNYDARSWCGRWMWDEVDELSVDPYGLFNTLAELLERYRDSDEHVAVLLYK